MLQKILMLSFLLMFAMSCGKESEEGGSSSKANLGSPIEPEAFVLEETEERDYTIEGLNVQEVQTTNVTSRGDFCATDTGKETEFRCGLGTQTGNGWVPQPDGCYHRLTGGNCSCDNGPDWYANAEKNCEGATLKIVDTCGYEKFVNNHPSCINPEGQINTGSRSAVVAAYNNFFRAPTPASNWSGDVSQCKAGMNSIEYQQRVIDQINFYRMMAGVKPARLNFNNTSFMKAALMMSANNRLSHYPEESWTCYSSEGSSGARSSNLALGASGPRAIDLYMDDPGAGNGAVGHRRWILNPPASSFATGDVPRANSLSAFNPGGNSFSGDYVTWPSEGYFPYQLLPSSRSNRWSFSKSGANFSNATVSMRNRTTGQSYTVELEPIRNGYGMNTLVFKPVGLSRSRPSQDQRIEVTISNVRVSSQTRTFKYDVIIINP